MKFLYIFWQWTFGILQSLLGFIIFLFTSKSERFWFHGALVVVWNKKSSLSLGGFIFITKDPYFYEKLKDNYTKEQLFRRLLVHEYGHTVQSLFLGFLYLPVMGIPSTVWGFCFGKKRREQNISYFSFFTEKWANRLGEKVTKEQSMENLIID